MWCEIQTDGKAKYCERYTDPLTLKSKKITVTLSKDTPSNRKKALEELNRKISEKCSEVSNENATLLKLYNDYMSFQKLEVKASTYERNERTLKNLVKLLGADALLDKLTANYIKVAFQKTGKAAGTLNEYLRRLKAMLNWGYQNDYHSNVNLLKKLTKFNVPAHRNTIQDKYFEPEEFQKLLEAMENAKVYDWYYLAQFMLLSGLRVGEAISLSKDDFIDGYINVSKTIDHKTNLITDTPKTDMSFRQVYIQPELEILIGQINRYEKEKRFAKGIRSDLFMCSSSGKILRYEAFEKYLKENTEKIIGRRLTSHSLRHTHTSMLAANGVDFDTISRRLGHASSKVTREIYTHVTKQMREYDNKQLKNISLL